MNKKTLFKTWFLLVVVMLSTNYSMAQVAEGDVLWKEPFKGGSSSTTFSATSSWSSCVDPTTFVSSDKSSLSYTSANAMCNNSTVTNMTAAHIWLNKSTTGYFQVSGIKLYNTKKIKVSWSQNNTPKVTCYYAFDGGSTYTELHSNSSSVESTESSEFDVSGHSTISLKFQRTSNNTNVRIDNLTLTATAVIPPHELSFDGGDNGTISAIVNNEVVSSGDDVDYGASVTLTATPSVNYQFSNWTDVDGNVLSEDNPYTFSMPDEDMMVFANFVYVDPNTEYDVVVDDVVGGTITASPLKAKNGQTVTISVTVDDGYEFDEWDVTEDVVLTGNADYEATFTMPSDDVLVSAKFNKLYTITFSDGGSVRQETAGEDIDLPSRTAPEGFSFRGWGLSDIATETTTAPEVIYSTSYTPTADITLYPIYARVVGDPTIKNVSVTVEDYANTNNWENGKQYTNMTLNSDITASVSSGTNTGKYYTNDQTWRLYANESATITIAATTGFELTSVTFTFTTSDNGALKNGSTSLTSGTPLSVSGSSASFSTTSTSGTKGKVFIKGISVSYKATTTTYYTSHPAIISVSLSAAGYATYCAPYALDFTGLDVKAYKATVAGDKVSFSEVTKVPAGAGVLLKADVGSYAVPVTASASALTGNAMVGVTESNKTLDTTDGDSYYVLRNKNGNVGFYKVTAETYNLKVGTAYLHVAGSSAKSFFGFDGTETGVEYVATESQPAGPTYNLQGQRVGNDYRGIVIVNGKKVINK